MLPAFRCVAIAIFVLHLQLSHGFFFRQVHNRVRSTRSFPSQLMMAKSHKVTVQHDGKDTVLEVREDESILEAALDAGIDMPHDCKLGVCLTCPSKIVSGKVDQDGSTLDDSVMERGYALTCMTFPRSDCVVATIDEDELVNAQFSRD